MAKNIDLKFKNNIISVKCDDSEKLLGLADKVNEKFDSIVSNYNNSLDDVKALFLLAIIQQEEITALEKYKKENNDNVSLKEAKDCIQSTVAHIAKEIDNLALKVKKK